ncbi:MAG: Proline--tRNA ligase [Firmicutes bacterium ADurb.Bin099]|nr:MAG: Proline--tRNA ligase [Firmicutes bacterium ADurb.Bin099]
MYYSRMLIPTIRETPQETEAVSHKLMLKAGLIRRLASGVYIFLPLGYKALRNIEKIIREEMDKKGALELLMSALIPKELLEQSGRWEVFGPEMFRLKDRSERELCLAPAHEESFIITARNEIRSIKNLPLTLYQIQTKFRDELRPRYGIIRSREFLMKDAYSFDKDESGLDKSYNDMHDAYCNIFARCGLDVVIADGAGSEEFMVLSDIGEDKVVTCTVCDYAANQEKAEAVIHNTASSDTLLNKELLHTPNIKTIDDLCSFMGCSSVNFAKTLILVADGQPVMAVIRGDHDLSLKKLAGLLKCDELSLAEDHLVEKLTGAAVGFASPVGMKCKVVLDNQLRNMTNFVTGANKTDYHYINVNLKDFTSYSFGDIRAVCENDVCPKCGGGIRISSAVEVGHIFKSGDKYSKALDCVYTDEFGEKKPMIMGCYGIGLDRTLAAVIEQHNDEKGIVWPMEVAPYKVYILPTLVSDPVIFDMAVKMHDQLVAMGIDVILDDRNERAGVKFNDADLLGIPLRVTVGRNAKDGMVELKKRNEEQAALVTYSRALQSITENVREYTA